MGKKKVRHHKAYLTPTATAAFMVTNPDLFGLPLKEKTVTETQKTKVRIHRVRLTSEQNYRLVEFIKDNYAKLGKYDPEFARIAEDALGFPVSSTSIQERRSQFNIRSTLDMVAERNAARKAETKAKREEEKKARAAAQMELEFKNTQPPAPTNYPLPSATILERIGNLERLVVALAARLEQAETKFENNRELLKLKVFTPEDIIAGVHN